MFILLFLGEFIRDLVALESGGSGGVVWRIRANSTKLVCAVGSRNGTEETKLLVLDFDVHDSKWCWISICFSPTMTEKTLTSHLPFLALLFCKISCQTKWLFFFKQTNKKPIPIPPFKKFMMNSWEKHDEKKSIKYKKIIDYWTTRHPSYVLKYDYIISSYYNFNQFNVFFPFVDDVFFFLL